MKKLFCVSFLLKYSCLIFAQETRLKISFCPQLYFNKPNIAHDNTGFDPFTTRNTFGYNIGAEYERTTRYGLVLSAALLYGMQTHDIDASFDFTGYDPGATNNLSGAIFRRKIFARYPYVMPRIMLGYKRKIDNNYTLLVKAGMSLKMPLKGISQANNNYIFRYYSDDSLHLSDVLFARDRLVFGDKDGKLRTRIPIVDFYLGVDRRLHHEWFKLISIGMEYSFRLLQGAGADHAIIVSNNSRTSLEGLSTDHYISKDIHLGIRFSVGL